MARLKNTNWYVGKENADGTRTADSVEHCQLAVLMDIRDELQSLNQHLRCSNFMRMPHELREIRIATQGLRRKYRLKK